eukprot:3840815-Pyramimonas_sp.AAC.1
MPGRSVPAQQVRPSVSPTHRFQRGLGRPSGSFGGPQMPLEASRAPRNGHALTTVVQHMLASVDSKQ